jgi:putative ABC transport system ATP-binding protein
MHDVMTADMVLECDQVCFSYAGGKPVFDHLNASFPADSFTLLKGPSGSGKSTLLRLLVRLEVPSSGTILFQGRPVDSYPPASLRKQIGYLQQSPTLVPGTVRHNLLLPFTFSGNRDLPPPDDRALRRDLDCLMLHEVSLDQSALELSVGQQQRLCLLRSLGLRPKALLLDEPTSALDSDGRHLAEELIREATKDTETTLIFVSHHDLESSIPHQRMLLSQGKIFQAP